MTKTKIEWCDSTVNFWWGCSPVSAGCQNCYARAMIARFRPGRKWGHHEWSMNAAALAKRLNRKPWVCNQCGKAHNPPLEPNNHPAMCPSCRAFNVDKHGNTYIGWHGRRVFVNDMSDWLDPDVPIEWLATLLDTIRLCDDTTFILCTKRPELFEDRFHKAKGMMSNGEPWVWANEWDQYNRPPKNVWLLASVENQEAADRRIPDLLKIPAAVRGLNLEPLLGPIDVTPYIGGWTHRCKCKDSDKVHNGYHRTEYSVHPCGHGNGEGGKWMCANCGEICETRPACKWLIIGGESGPKARPCNVEWIRSLVEQGKAAGVPVFVKQTGSQPVHTVMDHAPDCMDDHCALAGGVDDCDGPIPTEYVVTHKHPKGGDPSEWPEDVRVREFPRP